MPHEALEEAHEIRDLLSRTPPVFGGEAVDSQIPDPQGSRRAHGPADRLDPAPVPLEAGQAPLSSPAAIPIHDDGNVGRHPLAWFPAGKGWIDPFGFAAHDILFRCTPEGSDVHDFLFLGDQN